MRAWFLNLGPSSTTTAEANADIEAIWATEPGLLLGCESNGKGPLPGPGKGNVKIRDVSIPGRANLFAYARGVERVKWDWEDCNYGFPRNKYPGMHWPRSILRFPYRGAQVVVAHKPPLWKGAAKARWEHDQRLTRMMDPDTNRKRARMLFWDCNGMDGARALAESIDCWVVGDRIDNALLRKARVVEYGYRRGVEGHTFATDHPWGALYLRLELP